MNANVKQAFNDLIRSISLFEIVTISLASRRFGNPISDAELNVTWKQALADGDPQKSEDGHIVFRFKFETEIRQRDHRIFEHVSEFALTFTLEDESIFDTLWQDSEIQKIFLGEQVTHTVWPIFRQHIIDGMTRLSLKPITLPWLFKSAI